LLLPLIVVLVRVGAGTAIWRTIRPTGGEVAAGKGPLAPAIVASTIDGAPFSLAAQRGKVVVLYSMAAWCTACVPEATALGQMAPAVGATWVVTLLVDESPQSDSPQAVRGFRARSLGPDRYWVIDRGGSIARAFGIAALDSTVVVDRGGHIAAHYQSSVDLATLEAAVRRLL
jgi:peroxiredoxin